MHKIILTILLYLVILAGHSAAAEQSVTSDKSPDKATVEAQHIFAACKYYFKHTFNTRENIARKATCNGYFFGIGGTLLALKTAGKRTGICIPNSISTHEIIRIFLNWSDTHYDQLQIPAADAVIMALSEQYSCS